MKSQVLAIRIFILFLLLFFSLESRLWAVDSDSKSNKSSASSLSSSKGKKPPQKEVTGRKKAVQKAKKGDTKPMPALNDAPFSAEVPLLAVIREAKARLAKQRVSYVPGSGGKPDRRELKLALADFKTGKIQIVSGAEENHRLFLNDPHISYAVNWWNGFNSSIDILEPANTGIVGLLYALDPKRKSALRREAVIYTPYSDALLQPELVESGRLYLRERIAQARNELHHVSSRAASETPLGKAPDFTEEDYFNLILAEHMDPESFRSITAGETLLDPDQERRLVRLAERILVIIGANLEDAYRFTGNYASARGLAQFTPVGMRVVWNRYTTADISRDFYEATGDHLSAIKAEICLLDHYLADVLRVHPALAGSGFEKYAAGACYNGGPKNVFYGLKNFGVRWLYPQRRFSEMAQKGSLTARERRELEWLRTYRNHETFIYLNKMHAIEGVQSKLSRHQAPAEPAMDMNPPVDAHVSDWAYAGGD